MDIKNKLIKCSLEQKNKIDIGDNVLLHIPSFDSGPSDQPNLLCIFLDIKNDLYQLGCNNGILDVWYARNAFDDTNSDKKIEKPNVPLDIKLSKREAVQKSSIGHGQGFVHCSCTSGCKTNRCGCKKSGLFCNSRCHGGNSLCINKECC